MAWAHMFTYFLCLSAGCFCAGCVSGPSSGWLGYACSHTCHVPALCSWEDLFRYLLCPRDASWWLGHVCSHVCHVVALQYDGLAMPVHMPFLSQGCTLVNCLHTCLHTLFVSAWPIVDLGRPTLFTCPHCLNATHGSAGMSVHMSAMPLCLHLVTWACLFAFLLYSSSVLGRIACMLAVSLCPYMVVWTCLFTCTTTK